jgi:hypothetical protein
MAKTAKQAMTRLVVLRNFMGTSFSPWVKLMMERNNWFYLQEVQTVLPAHF